MKTVLDTAEFSQFLATQSWMQVIRALYVSSGKRTLRELAELSGLSVAGTKDVLRRLAATNVVDKEPKGNRVFYSLRLTPSESHFLSGIFQATERQTLETRAMEFSKRQNAAIAWIKPTLEKLHLVRTNLTSPQSENDLRHTA